MSNKKISQFQEVLSIDGTTWAPVIQGAPLFNAVIKPDKFIDTAGGMMRRDFVGPNATESVNDSDKLGGLPANDYVTYNDNNQDIDLLNNIIATKGIHLNTSDPYVVADPGDIGWNNEDGTINIRLFNDTILQAGQEIHFYGKALGNIQNRDVLQFAGVQGNHILMKKAVPSEIDSNPEYLIGIATQNINNGHFGYSTWFGKINDVYTTGWNSGDKLYFDFSTGGLINVKPQAPTRTILLAAVIKLATGAAENGKILVRPTFGMKLTDLDDVNGTPLTSTGQLMIWDNDRKVFDFTDNITYYQKLSEKGEPGGYASLNGFGKVTQFETDPVFSAAPAATITNGDIYNWNTYTVNIQEELKKYENKSIAYAIALG